MEYTEEDMQRLVAEFQAKLDAQPVKARHPAATESSTTARGGTIVATSSVFTVGGRVALVGDAVRYPDGSEARIVSGAGAAAVHKRQPVALVGSALDNGDTITGPTHEGLAVVEREGSSIAGLFDPDYIPPQRTGTLQ